MAKALGDQFMVPLGQIGPHLRKYLDDCHPQSDKEMVIGCLAEVFKSCKAAIPAYFNDFMQVIFEHAGKNHSGINRNCAYGIGIVAEHSPVMFLPHL
mmetsp:Transcript_5130/g.3813  ORF Transcript_5130/g.3813 Transcript_5130/m.3813 type:complete len:97 (-) Transcript_5130:456-746(-)